MRGCKVKRAELKNEIESGIRMTCGSWGEAYLMIDESAAFEAMVEAFGGIDSQYEAQRNAEKGDDNISIFELGGKFYAVNGDRYIECKNPEDECPDGLLQMIGNWQEFDEMKTERDYGRAYAEVVFSDTGRAEVVDVDEIVHGTVDIPTDDYDTMVSEGIENPRSREYWAGYNEFMREHGGEESE
jgi:NAD-dependent dihydropyrimidine dehydrogenase PreA subunit